MKDSSSNKLNENDLDYCSETNHADETSCVVDEKFVPKVGMIFKTLEEAGKFYKHYFKLAGFSTKIRNMTRDRDKIKNQLITRKVLKQHRELSMFVHCTIETNEEARIRPSKIYQSFLATASSHRELSFIEKDVRNYITREVRNISKQGDAKEFGKYLLRMKEKNQDFFFELNLEGDHCIKHAFWADARSRAACSFVGMNHHGQSTLLGCALMKNEDIQSFKWLFNCWLHCMGGTAPKGMLIDQCALIQRAIELCMPTTIHRWGIWHIMKKIPHKLNGYKRHDKIEQEMSYAVWNSYTKDAFDRNWNDFLTKYGLGGNKWLSVYLDHHFWAGMRSTQRSESRYVFFNKFITRNSSLRQFVKQYDNYVASTEQRKREFDAADFHTVIPCATKLAIEAQF
ncbi:protein FAR-RED IMPAIRED RESPONSE 1-like [Arachis stenosperma]|uniref:protein FAR-RED IMPAIRED RESPONSE 1-like n=1 Tax=Arachis stenosperma TaxID=217475 RepID=UPI0025ABD53E|nr:protein FAR-RED IMPAIRED RESPONSE 1-like [Arachis stenosperma]